MFVLCRDKSFRKSLYKYYIRYKVVYFRNKTNEDWRSPLTLLKDINFQSNGGSNFSVAFILRQEHYFVWYYKVTACFFLISSWIWLCKSVSNTGSKHSNTKYYRIKQQRLVKLGDMVHSFTNCFYYNYIIE